MNEELLRKNLIFLRKNKGYSQKELSKRLGYQTSDPVKDWEKGLAIPISKLPDIANEFGISLSALQNVNIEEYSEKLNIDENYLTKLFPFCDSDKALKNIKFQKALNIHKKIIDREEYEEFYNKSLEAYKLYYEAFKEGVDESIINMMSVACNYKFLAKNFDFNLDEKEVEKAKKILDSIHNTDSSNETKERNFSKTITIYNKEEKCSLIEEFIKETTPEMLHLLKKMRQINIEMYEYYTAILFVHNLIETGYKKEENALFGEIYYKLLLNNNNRYIKELEEALIKE